MDEKLIQELLAAADPAEKSKLVILNNAVVNTAEAYKKKSTAAGLKDWQSAEEAMTNYVADLVSKYKAEPEEAAVDMEGPWKTKTAVLAYLKASGFKIEKQTFFNHTKPDHNNFKLAKIKGVFPKDRVDKYAKEFLPRIDSGLKVGEENSGLARTKQENDIAKQEFDMERARFNFDKERGKYILCDDLYREIIGRTGVLDSGYNFMIQAKALEIITLVGGDQKKIPEFLAYMKGGWDTLLSSYGRLDNIEIVFTADD